MNKQRNAKIPQGEQRSTAISEHTKFRTTKQWKVFRQSILAEREHRCQCCGIPKKPKGLQLHHKKPQDYTDLSHPEDFVLVCSECHKLIERMSRRFRGKNASTILNAEVWYLLLSPYFPEVHIEKGISEK